MNYATHKSGIKNQIRHALENKSNLKDKLNQVCFDNNIGK